MSRRTSTKTEEAVSIEIPPKLLPVFDGDARYRGAYGGRGCVHPDTPIDTPRGQVAIKDFTGGWVWSWHGGTKVQAWARASQPFTTEQLYEVGFEDGRSIIVTDQHKFLTDRGWVELRNVSAQDCFVSLLPKYDASRPRSTSDTSPSGSPEDGQRSRQKPSNSLDRYFGHSRQYGPPLQTAAGIGQSCLPLSGGGQQRNSHVSYHVDAQVPADIGSLSSSSFLQPNQRVQQVLAAPDYARQESYSAGISSGPSWVSYPSGQQFPANIDQYVHKQEHVSLPQASDSPSNLAESLQTLFGKPDDDAHDGSWKTLLGRDFCLTNLAFIRKHSTQRYWDLHVEKTNNYLSNGIVNHNSGKTRTFAKMTAVYAIRLSQMGISGTILCCREFMNSLSDSSFSEIKQAIQETPWMIPYFDIGDTYIKTKDGKISYLFYGLRRNLNSIKSIANILLCWIDEAEQVSEKAWVTLIPTVRGDDKKSKYTSEIWVTWNPMLKKSATHKRFRQFTISGDEDARVLSDDVKIVELNWRDNPWFPKVLERERQDDLLRRPEQYNWIWEGDFATAMTGAYFASHLNAAKMDGRITEVNVDPLMGLKAFWDIGGTGAKADATSIWIVQWIGQRINIVDHYTAQSQELSTHVAWLRGKGYKDAVCYLPHDGAKHNDIYNITWQSQLEEADFETEIVPNQGPAAAKMRVEAARRHFSKCWFDSRRTEDGRVALGFYHEKVSDDERAAMLGPEHDWSSNCSDAFGMIFVAYEMPKSPSERMKIIEAEVEDSWVM